MNITDSYILRFQNRAASRSLNALFQSAIVNFVKARIKNNPSIVSILEIGTGAGYWIKEFENHLSNEEFSKLQITGCDINIDLITFARQWSRELKNIHFTEKSFKDLIVHQMYDLIFLIDVYQHFPIKERFNLLLKIHKCLNKKGRIIIVDKELFTFYGLKTTLIKKAGMLPKAWRSAKYFSFNLLKKRLSDTGIVSCILQEGHFRAILIE